MLSSYWSKVLRDLHSNKLRNALMLTAVVIGIIGTGSVLTSYSILNYEISHNFASTNPPSFRLYIDNATPELANEVQNQPGIALAEVRGLINARIQIGENQWSPLKLFVINDFQNLKVSKFDLENGSFPTNSNDIVIERSSITTSLLNVNHTFILKTPDGAPTQMKVSGIVHDAAQAPGWQDFIDYGYISINSLSLLGEPIKFTELHAIVSEDATNVTHITSEAYQMKEFVESKGYSVSTVDIPIPGHHPHTDQMDSLIFLLEIFGLLTLLLSGLLVINTILFLLKQQTKQIGIMKVLGGQISKISKIYFTEIIALGLGAIIIGIPVSTTLGMSYAKFTANLLNFNITSGIIPIWVYATLILVGLAIPLITASYPIIKYSSTPVMEALNEGGSYVYNFGNSIFDKFLMIFKGFNRPLILSLRNTFRKKFRLFLVIIILSLAGATFISALNVGASWSNTIDYAISYHKYDYKVELNQPYPIEEIESIVGNVSGVKAVESWQKTSTVQILLGNIDGLRFRMTAVPANTTMISYPLLNGRWLLPNDTNALVVNQELFHYQGENINIGSILSLRTNNITKNWTVVGIINEIGAPRRGYETAAAVYVNRYYYNSLTNSSDLTTSIRIKSNDTSMNGIKRVSQNLEIAFAQNGIKITDLQSTQTRLEVLREHLVVIVAFLIFMALLIAIVGGLALTSLISMSVFERSREIGIMRSTGARNKSIIHIFLTEGLLIGMIGWIVGSLLSYYFSVVIGNFAGWIFLKSNLQNVFPLESKIIWLALSIILSIIATIYPARASIQKPIHEVISYE